MRPDVRRIALALAAVTVLALGCGDSERRLRIGVIVDCVGINRSLGDAELSAAALPLVERGARVRGPLSEGGLTRPLIAGRRVELVRGCTEALEFSALAAEMRRLVEHEHVDVVLGAGTGPDEIAMRDVARLYPRVAFVPVVHGPREVTLRKTAPNLYRFSADQEQGTAGLASYAYRQLGWRRAAIVLANWDPGWSGRDTFVAEFCALGGTVTHQVAVDFFDPAGRDVARLPRHIDGVAVFVPKFFGPAGFLRRLAATSRDPARRIVVGPGVADDGDLLPATGGALAGAIASSATDPQRLRAYLRAFARAFPGIPPRVAGDTMITSYRDAMEAVVESVEQRPTNRSARMTTLLSRARPQLLGGPVRLDAHGQAVVSSTLVRLRPPSAGALEPVQTVRVVDQSVGGLLAPTLSPNDRPATCRRGSAPPPWAR
jgi:branched-chain amino acid transport system substrate-binding protein